MARASLSTLFRPNFRFTNGGKYIDFFGTVFKRHSSEYRKTRTKSPLRFPRNRISENFEKFVFVRRGDSETKTLRSIIDGLF